MVSSRFRSVCTAICTACLIPAVSFAQTITGQLTVGGTTSSIGRIVDNIITFLSAAITGVASAMFLVGAFMIVLAGAKEDYKQKGKDLMMGALLSLAVVLGAYSLYKTVAFFLL